MQTDYLIVGSGLTGSVIGRILKDRGNDVLIVDRRNNLGGNLYDYVHPSGIRIHEYGPHYFRTSSDEIWAFVNRFVAFYPFQAIVKAYVDGKNENWPISAEYIERTIGHDWTPGFSGESTNFEEACLKMMPEQIYRKFVKGYSEKQWGRPPSELTACLAGRFDIRKNNDPRLKIDKYQGLPVGGYSALFDEILQNIPKLLGVDFLKHRALFKYKRKLIFTGPIDEFFDCDLGRLEYRGQKREHKFLPQVKTFRFPVPQINFPNVSDGRHHRIIEWKHLMPHDQKLSDLKGTVLTRETSLKPQTADQYEYPYPSSESQNLYEKYRQKANKLQNVIVCGRLGEYKYYDMDIAIQNAFDIAAKIS